MAITLDGTSGITTPGLTDSGSATVTGNVSAAALIPSSSTVPTNGLFLPATNALGFATNSTERLRLDASGNLGLGVTPSYKLDVNGYLRVGGTSPNASGINVFNSQQYLYTTANWNYSNLNLVKPSTNTASPRFLSFMLDGDADSSTTIGGFPAIWGIYSGTPTTGSTSSGLSAKMGLAAYAGFNFYINGTQAMTLDASGNLLVGTTTQANNARVTVFSDNATAGGVAIASSASLYRQMYLTSTGTVLQFWNGTNQASLTSAGVWTNASDARLKKDIVDIKYGLSTVLASEPRSFKRVDVDGDFIGFIAQEIKNLVPEVVFGSDAEGDQYTVDYGSLVAVAFKAIQELNQRLEALENK